MQLNELIEEEGIENVAIKTTISQDNLNYLIDEKFEKLSRVKALGFLLILEREYKELEVSELREHIKLFFENNQPDYDNVIVVSRSLSTSSEGFSFFKWFVIVGILFGSWYLYTEGKLDGLLQNITNKKDIYSDDKALENNTTQEEAEKISITKDTQEPVSIVAPVEPKVDLEAEVVEEENRTEETVKNPETMQSSVSKELTKIQESQPLLTKAEENVVTLEDKTEIKAVPAISTITINPTRGMLWFGFINVDTKKKKEFMKQVSTPFDIKDGRWILVTGHGFLDIASEVKTLEVSDRNKHYFYIDSKEIKEISQQEFRTLNGGHGWI